MEETGQSETEEINEGESCQEYPDFGSKLGESRGSIRCDSKADVSGNTPSCDRKVEANQSTASGLTNSNRSSLKYPSWTELEAEGFWIGGEEEEDQSGAPCISETEESPSTETQEKSGESTISSEALTNVYAKLSPFNIHWAFGVTRTVEIINLTTEDSFEVLYVASHFAVLYNYRRDKMTFLPGHNSIVTSTSVDSTGRWVVTADAGEDTVIIIWDRKKTLPAWCLYNVFPGEGVKVVKISQDARFLAAINCNFNYTLKFWMWTYGRDEPDGVVNLDPEYGKANHINFNHNNTEQFAISLELLVVFCQWNSKTKTLASHTPKFDHRLKKTGVIRKSLFLDDNHSVLSATSLGYVIVWSDLLFIDTVDPEKPITIEKNFLKVVKFHSSGITNLCLCDGFIATASEEGMVKFHDQQCRLMYYIPTTKIGPLMSISFNIEPVPFFTELDSLATSENEEIENILEYDVSSVSVVKIHSQVENFNSEESLLAKSTCDVTQPTDCTYEAKPIEIRDFMFMSTNGKIGYMRTSTGKVRYYLSEVEGVILSLDCHPSKPHLVTGTTAGRVLLYDHNIKKRLLSESFQSPVTTLKYSSMGYSIVAGFQNGDLLQLNSLLLQVLYKFETPKFPIQKICWSEKDDFLAYFDQSSLVQVFKRKSQKWASMGKYISHYKPTVDMLFQSDKVTKLSRLFTIGEDRMLIEYDMQSQEENKLQILSAIRIEQSAIPRCFIWLTECYKSPRFLLSNDQYKLKVLDTETHMCQKTTLGPTADTPINFMKVIKDDDEFTEKVKMVYTTDKHIGIRLLPPTGNPFEGMGMVAHPEKLIAFAVSHDHKFAFTVGVKDSNPLMWKVNPTCVDVASTLGGNGVEPFISLMEGGPNSFLFQEMEDLFYYAQIIHQGEDPNTERTVSKSLALCEIPDLFRALGFFPTDYEVNNLLYELKHLNYEKTGQITEEITFEECVKAFLNHRSVNGISLTEVNNSLLTIADLSDPSDIIVERNELYRALEEKAEGMDHAEVVGYLCVLLLPKDEENPVPHSIKLSAFAEVVLGIDFAITEENVREITHSFEKK